MGVEDSVRMDLAWVKGAYKQLGDESHFVRPQMAHHQNEGEQTKDGSFDGLLGVSPHPH